MRHPITKKHVRRAVTSRHAHHVAWGMICTVLALVLLATWSTVQTLRHEVSQLETKLSSQTTTCTARNTWSAGTTKQFTVDGRAYYVHLPASFSPTSYYPLIMYFPGKGATALGGEQQASGFDTLPVVTIYPELTMGTDGYTAWKGAPYSSKADDVKFTSDILNVVQSQLCIKRDQTYAAGMSNGGGFVSILSCELGDRFAAFGIMAGAFYAPTGSCHPPRATPIINIHSVDDSTVPYRGSAIRRLPAIEAWVDMRARFNSCSPLPITTYQGTDMQITTWQHCTDDATIKNIRLSGVGHTWTPDASQLMWQFFSQHTL